MLICNVVFFTCIWVGKLANFCMKSVLFPVVLEPLGLWGYRSGAGCMGDGVTGCSREVRTYLIAK